MAYLTLKALQSTTGITEPDMDPNICILLRGVEAFLLINPETWLQMEHVLSKEHVLWHNCNNLTEHHADRYEEKNKSSPEKGKKMKWFWLTANELWCYRSCLFHLVKEKKGSDGDVSGLFQDFLLKCSTASLNIRQPAHHMMSTIGK